MRSGWVGGGVTDEKGGSRKRGGSGPPDPPPPPLDTPMTLGMSLELFCCHLIRLNHDINKLVEIIYVGITKQIMPRPSGDTAEWLTLEVIILP